MSAEILMPKLSDTMEEGKILRWLKHSGDPISAGEVIAEVETDKADMELEAPESGVLGAIQVQEGESAPVGAVLATLEPNGERGAAKAAPKPASSSARPDAESPAKKSAQASAPATAKTARGEKTPESGPRESAPSTPAGPKASAAARALAEERGIDLATLKGSGPAGRIVSEDVEAADGGQRTDTEPPRDRPAARAREGTAPVTERHELSRMRRSIARRMSEAFREIPHFAVTAEVDMSEAVRLKDALEKSGVFSPPVTYTHMVLKATALALTRHPRLNASYREEALDIHADVNLGMAVAVEDGLIVPVLRRADQRSLGEIASEARRLAALAKQGRFASEELSGGTFTVSNMGMLDIEAFTAVINPPQAAILAVGSIKPRAVVRNGALAVAHTMFVTVSCDHRIIDGVMAGRFLEELKTLLENPIGLVLS